MRQRPHYGSTESLSSLGSQNRVMMNDDSHHHRRADRTTQTPTASIYSQNEMDNEGSNNNNGNYDVPQKSARPAARSNSRVASVGRLRLRVESFRQQQQQQKNSSGTQTELTVMRNNKDGSNNNSGSTTTNGKYTGQYKKHAAPPNKPARKTKQGSGGGDGSQRRSGGSEGNQSSGRSDRSASPDNSSTSGYSSPSAGIHSKETSPYGSKIGEKMGEEEEEENGSEENGGGSKITVIQIVPATLSSGGNGNNIESNLEEEEADERSSRNKSIGKSGVGSSVDEDEEIGMSAVEELRKQHQQPVVRKRELPRIATNGSLSGGPNGRLFNSPVRRKLPERVPPEPPSLATLPRMSNGPSSSTLPPAPGFNTGTARRLYQRSSSNLPRPAPQIQPQPPQFLPHHLPRVPLPPVPELDRSDHERDSISPAPPQETSKRPTMHPASSRPLPSPLTTPVKSNMPIPRARRNHLFQKNVPGLDDYHYEEEEEETEAMDDRLRALLDLLSAKGDTAANAEMEIGGGGDSATVQYLAQLESVARRLKDQLLMEQPQVYIGLLHKR